MKRLLIALAALLLVPANIPMFAAQPRPKKTGGVTISPASQEIIVQPKDKTPRGSFKITNQNAAAETFTLSAIDMGALDETGGLAFTGLAQDYQKKYGLAPWISLNRTSLRVKPGATETITFTIRNDDSLSPGGHYGAVVVRRAGEQTSRSDQVAFSPQAATLLFVRKVGGEVLGLSLPRVETDHSVWRLPTEVKLPFKNDGNVHVVPRGVVRLIDPRGREIAKGIINPESALILPERSRTFPVALEAPSRTIWPGRYTIEVTYRYDGQDQTTRLSQTFYTANLRILLLLVFGALALIFILYRLRKHKAGRSIARRLKFWRRKKSKNNEKSSK
jgi:hypothetical protein